MKKTKYQNGVLKTIFNELTGELQHPIEFKFECSSLSPIESVELNDGFVGVNFSFVVNLDKELADLQARVPDEAMTVKDAQSVAEDYLSDEVWDYIKPTEFVVNEYFWHGDRLIITTYQPLTEDSGRELLMVIDAVKTKNGGGK